MKPLSRAAFGRIEAVFTDVDGTLTTRGALLPSTLAAMARLREGGVKLVLVTGRPSGWGECWARTLPVDGVIAENGGLWFAPVRGRWEKRYAEAPAVRARNRRRLTRLIAGALRAVPGAALSMDAVATEVDLAFDYNEHVRLGPSAAASLEHWLRKRGVTAVRSSVHVNCWLGPFDKLSTARAFVRREWGKAFDRAQRRFAFAGDSLNDAPMFGGFTHSVGVANVREVLGELSRPPAYVTRAAEGHGFEELARAILAPEAAVSLVKLELAQGLARHVRAGHPWVFRKGLLKPPRIPAGSIVDLCEGSRFVARGYYDPHSPIAVRVLTTDSSERVDGGFVRERIRRAYAARQALVDLTDTNGYRLVHGEADGLPGIVVDLYDGFAVVKLYSAGLTPMRPMLLEALRAEVPGLKGIVGRDEVGRDDFDGDEPPAGGRVLWGERAPEPLLLKERGVSLWVDVYHGQKTGLFLDQRENRHLIRRVSSGRRVLNCFSYTGGFSVNAALGGAVSVFSIDSDADAIALARQNFTANGLKPEQHDFLAADVFEALGSFKDEGRTFDLVILDPPAFAKNQKAVQAGLDGYASLNRQALALLPPGGLLATASCSARVSPEAFLGAVKEAGFKLGVQLALVEERYQPPDHPIRLQFPEGRYLKFLLLRVA